LDLEVAPLPQLHDRPGAEGLLDLADRVVQRLLLGRHRLRLVLDRLLPGHGIPSPNRPPRRSVRPDTILARGRPLSQGGVPVFSPPSGARARGVYVGPLGESREANVTISRAVNDPADHPSNRRSRGARSGVGPRPGLKRPRVTWGWKRSSAGG